MTAVHGADFKKPRAAFVAKTAAIIYLALAKDLNVSYEPLSFSDKRAGRLLPAGDTVAYPILTTGRHKEKS
jgi:hypothetical protein